MVDPVPPYTFLLCDIEGSSRMWEQHAAVMRDALSRYHGVMTDAVQAAGGRLYKIVGDQLYAVFTHPSNGLQAARAAQQALSANPWSTLPLRVRMALHCGPAIETDSTYDGPAIYRTQRLLSAVHGGQTLLSGDAQVHIPPGAFTLLDLGHHYLRDLSCPEQVFQLIISGLPNEFPPLRSMETFRHNLSMQPSRFIGRASEIQEIKRILISPEKASLPRRVVTLLGVGGVGKTRLALQVAAELVDVFNDGVWLADLTQFSDPALASLAIARAVGIAIEPGRPPLEALTAYLHTRQALLVLDNCEHMIEASVEIIETILRTCPALKILTTSREALGFSAETSFQVPSLSLCNLKQPGLADLLQSEAVQLFVDRAQQVASSFALDDETAPLVNQICHRLDGIPLAIEIVAACLGTIPLDQIVARLENRYRLLTGGRRTTLPRQQTLRAAFDWAYDLLLPQERVLLRRLSVFVGGIDDAAVPLCAGVLAVDSFERRSGKDRRSSEASFGSADRRAGSDRRAKMTQDILPIEAIPDALQSLVQRSLLTVSNRDGKTRYQLLETIRLFARERLLASGEAERLHSCHLEYFARHAEEIAPQLWGPEQAAWMEYLDAEINNLRAAFEWSEASPYISEVEDGLRLAVAIWPFWTAYRYEWEGFERITRLLARDDLKEPTAARAQAAGIAGQLALELGNYYQAGAWLDVAKDLGQTLQDAVASGIAQAGLGMSARASKDFAAAKAALSASAKMFEDATHPAGAAMAFYQLGETAWQQNDFQAATFWLQQSLEVCQSLNHLSGIAMAHMALGRLARTTDQNEAAREHYTEAVKLWRTLCHSARLAEALAGVGQVALMQNDLPAARASYEESLSIQRFQGNKRGCVLALARLDEVTRLQGDFVAGRAFYEEALNILHEMNPNQGAVGSLFELGYLCFTNGEIHQALSFFQESLTLCLETGDTDSMPTNLLGIASTLAHLNQQLLACRAARVLGHVDALTRNRQVVLSGQMLELHQRAVLQLTAQLGKTVVEEERSRGASVPFEQIITEALSKI